MKALWGALARRTSWRCLIIALAIAGCDAAHPPSPSKSDAGDGGAANDSGLDMRDAQGNGHDAGDAAALLDGSGSDDANVDGGEPDASPDAPIPWIAFVQIGSGGFGQLAFVKADGRGLVKLDNDAYETDPSWSPDGKKLAFAQFEPGVGNSLHVLDFETQKDVVVSSDFVLLSRPRWSPDGKTLIVAGTTPSVSVSALFRVDASTGVPEQITASTLGDGGHDVAPDGTLFFVRHLDEGFDIFAVAYTADPSTDPMRITTGSEVLGGVSTHPDGKHIYYSRSVAESSDLIELDVTNGDGRIIGEPGDAEPRAFVEGDKLVLSRVTFDSDSEIAIVDLDGALIKRCTNEMSFDGAPAPSPLDSDAIDVSGF